jgi:hypothetical protein
MATGAVTDLGASDNTTSAGKSKAQPNANAEPLAAMAAPYGTAPALGTPADRSFGRAQQEVDELCARKIGGVGHTGKQQRAGYQHHAPEHRVGPRRLMHTRVKRLGQYVDRECGRQAKQGRGGEVDPEFNEAGHRPLSGKG